MSGPVRVQGRSTGDGPRPGVSGGAMTSGAMVGCPQCGAENRGGARFCDSCGSPLEQAAAPRQARKTVTALFCDVTGSTALGEELDPEVLRGVLNRYFAEMRGIIERHGGTVEKFIGDAVMAVFGIPRVREDDALRAVRAAAEIRERLLGVAEEVGVELGGGGGGGWGGWGGGGGGGGGGVGVGGGGEGGSGLGGGG